jgi:hypothetical protein
MPFHAKTTLQLPYNLTYLWNNCEACGKTIEAIRVYPILMGIICFVQEPHQAAANSTFL